jgi:hypothetical protein
VERLVVNAKKEDLQTPVILSIQKVVARVVECVGIAIEAAIGFYG